jgi:hypothetical protein
LGGAERRGLGSFTAGLGFGWVTSLFFFGFFLASFAIQDLLCRESAALA